MSSVLTPAQTRTARRDLTAHITNAFDGLQVGDFLTCAQIGNVESVEYGSDKPSIGAIVARLFPENGNCTVPGIRPCLHPETGARGAMKVSEFEIDGVRWQTGPVFPTATL